MYSFTVPWSRFPFIITPHYSKSPQLEIHHVLAGVGFLLDVNRTYVWHMDMPVATRERGIVIFFVFEFPNFRTSGRRREHLLDSCVCLLAGTPSGQAEISPGTSLECTRWGSFLDEFITTFWAMVDDCLVVFFRYRVAALNLG